jgi:hypothetical protein
MIERLKMKVSDLRRASDGRGKHTVILRKTKIEPFK